MKIIHSGFSLIRQHIKAFTILNLVYFGLTLAAMGYSAYNRSLQQELLDLIGEAFSEGPLSVIGEAYLGGQLLMAILLTFITNLLVGTFLSLTLPSLIIPFSGILVGLYRALLWGLLFSPNVEGITASMVISGVLIGGLLFLEGEAYVLGMLAAYLQGKAFLFPGSVGASGRLAGYAAGLKQSAVLYVLIVLQLALAAIYEAVVAIAILPNLL
jgi:hypothetical protein